MQNSGRAEADQALQVHLAQLLLQLEHPEKGAQAHVQVAFGHLQGGDPTTSLGSLCQCSITWTAQKCSWCSEESSGVPIYAHCLLSWHWVPLTEPGSVLPLGNHNLPSGIYGHW